MEEKNKTLWLSGIKSILMIIVFLDHFTKAFGYVPIVDKIIRMSGGALNFLIDGTFALNIFLAICGYLAVKKGIELESVENVNWVKIVLNRYIRLAIPLFILNMIVFIVDKMGWLFSNQLSGEKIAGLPDFFKGNYDFVNIVYKTFVEAFFVYGSCVNPAMWMMSFLFLGYLLGIAVAVAIRKNKLAHQIVIIIILGLVLFVIKSQYYSLVVGMFLYLFNKYIEKYICKKGILFNIIGIVLIIVGFVLCDYNEMFRHYLGIVWKNLEYGQYYIIDWIAVTFILVGLGMCRLLQKLLSTKVLLSVSKICLPFWMFHNVCFATVGSYVYIMMMGREKTFEQCVKGAFVSSLILTIALSIIYFYLYEKILRKKIDSLINK